MKRAFVALFEMYGFTVESFGPDSYIADNGTFCVPFTIHDTIMVHARFTDIAAVSFLSIDKDDIKKYYKNHHNQHIGDVVFSDWMSDKLKFIHFGGLCNHDLNGYEVESWLKRIKK